MDQADNDWGGDEVSSRLTSFLKQRGASVACPSCGQTKWQPIHVQDHTGAVPLSQERGLGGATGAHTGVCFDLFELRFCSDARENRCELRDMSANVEISNIRQVVFGGGGRGEPDATAGVATDGGAGGDGPDDPELRARVAALEASLQRIETSLAHIIRDIGDIRQDGRELKRDAIGMAAGLADMKKDLAESRKEQVDQAKLLARLDGAVLKLPTNWQITLLVLAIIVVGFGRQFVGG